jgi:hypothetical protein
MTVPLDRPAILTFALAETRAAAVPVVIGRDERICAFHVDAPKLRGCDEVCGEEVCGARLLPIDGRIIGAADAELLAHATRPNAMRRVRESNGEIDTGRPGMRTM